MWEFRERDALYFAFILVCDLKNLCSVYKFYLCVISHGANQKNGLQRSLGWNPKQGPKGKISSSESIITVQACPTVYQIY